MILTNPPYSIKQQVIKNLLARGLSWALLVPYETPASVRVRNLFPRRVLDMEEMRLDGRVNFRMPHAGWSGAGAQFDTIWLSYRVTGEQITEGTLPHRLDFHRKVRNALQVEEVRNEKGKVVQRIIHGREPTRDELFAWSGFGQVSEVMSMPAQLAFDLAA